MTLPQSPDRSRKGGECPPGLSGFNGLFLSKCNSGAAAVSDTADLLSVIEAGWVAPGAQPTVAPQVIDGKYSPAIANCLITTRSAVASRL